MIDSQIKKIIDQQIARIADIIKAHGGGVEIVEATVERIELKLQGHCAGCPLAPMTFGVVLNKYLREALPQVKEINYTI